MRMLWDWERCPTIAILKIVMFHMGTKLEDTQWVWATIVNINLVLVVILMDFWWLAALWYSYVIVLTIRNAISQLLLKNVMLHMDSSMKDMIDVKIVVVLVTSLFKSLRLCSRARNPECNLTNPKPELVCY